MWTSSWAKVAAQKKAAQDAAIRRAAELLDSDISGDDGSLLYLRANASTITERIQSGEWTALEVTKAYVRQAAKAHLATNCLTEILFEQALQEAADLDTEFAKTQKLRGSLHGVPINIKDNLYVRGTDACIGYSAWANKPSQTDAVLVKHVRDAGGIIIAKTNVPQTMLSFECGNPVFGRTTNPWNPAYTCGGSSGGAAALLATDGSVLGIGSDIGGSLRIPAGYCGIYSLKTTPLRLSKHGAAHPHPGFEAIQSCYGPMARSVEDLDLMTRVLFNSPAPSFESIPPVPYRAPIMPERLRFGYYLQDFVVKSSPGSCRAVQETVRALEKAGHECIPFKPDIAMDAMEVFVALASADGYKAILAPLGSDPLEPSLFLPTLGPKIPSFLRKILAFIVSSIVGDKLWAKLLALSRTKSVSELEQHVHERDVLNERWYTEVWDKYGFDGIICPLQATPALPHGSTKTLSPLCTSTSLYNIINSPVGVLPVTRLDPQTDAITDEWVGMPGAGMKIVEKTLYGGKKPVYNPKLMQGLPVAIQIVGKKWEDEKVIAMMRIINDAFGPRSFGPGSWKGTGDSPK